MRHVAPEQMRVADASHTIGKAPGCSPAHGYRFPAHGKAAHGAHRRRAHEDANVFFAAATTLATLGMYFISSRYSGMCVS